MNRITMHGARTRFHRTMGALFAIAFLIAILLSAFFSVQVVRGGSYAIRAEENRLSSFPIPAPRGTITDREGRVVAATVTGYAVWLLPVEPGRARRTLEEAAPLLGLTGPRIDALLERRDARPREPVPILPDAPFHVVSWLRERSEAFPDLLVREYPRRWYPDGPAVAHLVGYLGEISAAELDRPEFEKRGYRPGQFVGRSGIEGQYEFRLAGRDGSTLYDVDALGRLLNPRVPAEVRPPRPGEDLQLTIDVELQKYIAEIFPDTMRGAVVAMRPSTGEVLALFSHPGFDPNDFVGGVSSDLWRALTQSPDKPMLNRAISALYPPASTFKPITAAIGLNLGVVAPGDRMPVPCAGGLYYGGRYFGDWYDPPGFGFVDLPGALTHSCNVYFYQLGLRIGLSELARAGSAWGFGRRTGVDLPGEKAGEFPADPGWYEARFGWAPTPAEVLSLAIGQGPNAQTVLKMAQFYSALAGDGTAPQPYLVVRPGAGEGPGELRLSLSAEAKGAIWEGMAGVTDWELGGTARLSALERWQLYGKTGTAQNPHGPDHGWFAGFAGPRGGSPEIVVVALVEHGRSGSDVAPLAAKAAEFFLDHEYGLPFDPEPTLLERLESGESTGG